MKSLTAVCQTGATMPTINPNGRAISRHQHPQRENAEMKMYLSKLKDLVPFMPKNRKLSKLEIIQHVIDYICDLQSELEAHPEMGNFDAASALNFVTATQNAASMDEGDDEDIDEIEAHADDNDFNDADEDALTQRLSAEAAHQQHQHQHQQQQQQQQQQQSSPAIVRQPLADRQAPNTILPATAPASHAAAMTQQQQQLQPQQEQQPQLAQSSQQTTSAEKSSRQNLC